MQRGRRRPSRPLPARLLDVEVGDGAVEPRYLSNTTDIALVKRAVSWVCGQEGRRREDVEAATQGGRPRGCGRLRWSALIHHLLGLCGYAVLSPIQPALLREAVFEAASRGRQRGRDSVLADVATGLGVPAAEIEQWLYRDIPSERRLEPLPVGVDPSCILRGYNLALAQGLMLRCEWVRVGATAHLTPLVRHARRQRLLCLVEREPAEPGSVMLEPKEHGAASDYRTWIHVSGPLSLFHHTTRYGRALAGWLPLIVRAPGWRLEASCCLPGLQPRRFVASHRDPIDAADDQPLRPFDSNLEAAFYRDLRREAGERLVVLRETDPVQVGSAVMCPDFVLVDSETHLRVGVEIVGFWTPDYLQRKLDLLGKLPEPWVVCVDENLAAGREEQLRQLPVGPLFLFRRRISATAFLEFLEHNQLL